MEASTQSAEADGSNMLKLFSGSLKGAYLYIWAEFKVVNCEPQYVLPKAFGGSTASSGIKVCHQIGCLTCLMSVKSIQETVYSGHT